MTEKVEIHISDVRSFRQCRRKWDWSSRLGRNLEPAIPYAPFFTGKAIHAALEFFYEGSTRPEDTIDEYLANEEEYLERLDSLWPMERKKLDDEIHKVRSLIDHYFLWQENDELAYSDKNLEFIEMERKWEVPIDIPVAGKTVPAILAGRFDGYCRHKPTNRYYVFETKTARSVDSFMHTLATDQQCTLYQWAANREYDVPIAGTIFNIMSKSQPKRPELTKAGRMSKNKRISTSWFYYVRALREDLGLTNAEIEADYGDFLTELKKNTTSKFFRRHPVERNKHQMDAAVSGLIETASEMLNPETKRYAAPSWMNCNFCLFKGPCIAKDMGGNYDQLLEHEFNLREGHESMRKEGE